MEQTYLKKINKASAAECLCHRKIRLMIIIIVAVGALFDMSSYSVRTYASDGNLHPEHDGGFGIFMILMGALFGAFAVFGIFSDLTNRQLSDVQMSLPMSAKDRYLSKILAVVKIHLIPLCLACASVVLVRMIVDPSLVNLEFLLRMNFIPISAAICVDAVCIFCMSCCGAKAEGVYTSIIMGFCISLTPYIFYSEAVVAFSGINSSSFDFEHTFSTFGGMCLMWLAVDDRKAWIYLLLNAAISCLLVFATYFIYRKRDGRNVGVPVVFPIYMELLLFVGLFSLYTMFFVMGESGTGIVLGLIVVLVIRIVAARAKITPKIFLTWLGKYAICFGAFMVIMCAAYFTGGYGYYKLRPRIKSTECLSINVGVRQMGYSNEHEGDFYGNMSDVEYITTLKEKHFDNKFFTDEHSKASYEQAYQNYSSILITDEEAEELLQWLSDEIDKNYDLGERNMDDFIDRMFSGNLERKSYTPGTYVDIGIDGSSNERYYYDDLGGYYENTTDYTSYYIDFKVEQDKYEELCEEFGSRLKRSNLREQYDPWETDMSIEHDEGI